MTIAIDFVGTNTSSGTKTYILNFCERLEKLTLEENIIIFLTDNYLSQINFGITKNKKIQYITKPNFYSNIIFRLIWMQIILPLKLKIKGINKLFSPMNICPLIAYILNIHVILGVHSNLPWLYFDLMPGNIFRRLLIKKISELSIKLSSKIIVCSSNAKFEISKLLSIDQNKINVVYLGIDNFYLENQNKKELFLNNFNYKNYIFSVSSIVRYHNIINMLKGFKNSISFKKSNFKFVISTQVLDQSYFIEIKNFINDNSMQEKVFIFENLDKKYLKNLYKYSSIYIFSSYTEVFGLTTLEAMSQGTKALISNTSSLPEINGKNAEYFDPDDIQEISNKIDKILLTSSTVNKNKKLYLEHLKKFSWEKSVIETLKIILN